MNRNCYFLCQCLSPVLHHVDLQANTKVLEEHTAFIFSPENEGSKFLWNIGIYLQM
jgi:hypothetical protein